MSDEFFRTQMGRRYYEVTLPQILREVGRLADNIASLNQTLEARSRPRLAAVPSHAQAASRHLRVLVVDDDERVLRAVERLLKQDHDVLAAKSADAALTLLDVHQVDVVLTDYNMPDKDGLWLLEQVRDRRPHVRRVLTSAQAQLDHHLDTSLVDAFVPKGAEIEELLASLRVATGRAQQSNNSPKHYVQRGAVAPDPDSAGDERHARRGDDP